MDELPTPPAMKNGWPWTEESQQIAERLPTGEAWPRVSIVTPSYNQAAFIEETIRSVLLQGYPNLEYIVMDGGSTDGSVDIIRKYDPWLAYWSSEPDRGQGHAISKGFEKATGVIFGWLNSDDVYCRGTLELVARLFLNTPNVGFLYGDCSVIDQGSSKIDHIESQPGGPAEFLTRCFIPQPSTFFRRTAWKTVGGINEALHYSMDYDLWLRMMSGGVEALYEPKTLACFRRHADSKSNGDLRKFGYEYLSVLKSYNPGGEEVLQKAKLKGFQEAFMMILAGCEAIANKEGREQGAELTALEQWSENLGEFKEQYSEYPEILGESLYEIGRRYCGLGRSKEGRRNYAMASKITKRRFRVITARVTRFLGISPYGCFGKIWRKLTG